jgi:hypothetical protein
LAQKLPIYCKARIGEPIEQKETRHRSIVNVVVGLAKYLTVVKIKKAHSLASWVINVTH